MKHTLIILLLINSINLLSQRIYQCSNGKFSFKNGDSLCLPCIYDSLIVVKDFKESGTAYWCKIDEYQGLIDSNFEFIIPYDYYFVGNIEINDSVIEFLTFNNEETIENIVWFEYEGKLGFRNMLLKYTTPVAIDITIENIESITYAVNNSDNKGYFTVNGERMKFNYKKGLPIN
jgi:hypothetical protein